MSQWLYQDLTIGSALKKLRTRAGLSQEQVASQLQIMSCNISRAIFLIIWH